MAARRTRIPPKRKSASRAWSASIEPRRRNLRTPAKTSASKWIGTITISSRRSFSIEAAALCRRTSSVAADASRTNSRRLHPVDRVAHRADHGRGFTWLEARNGRVRHHEVEPLVDRFGLVDVVLEDLDHVLTHRHALAGSGRADAPLKLHRHTADLQIDFGFGSHDAKYACISACTQAFLARTSAKRSRYVSTTRGQV